MSNDKIKKCQYVLDYNNKCDCREDDNCGCTYPNNLPQNFKQECNNKTDCPQPRQ